MKQKTASRSIKILVAKLGLDGHDRGALVLCRAFRDAGMEVIYSGLFATPERIAQIAEDEDCRCNCYESAKWSTWNFISKSSQSHQKEGN